MKVPPCFFFFFFFEFLKKEEKGFGVLREIGGCESVGTKNKKMIFLRVCCFAKKNGRLGVFTPLS